MKRELALDFTRVTEAAALAGYKWLGRGDKNAADGAAVAAMRAMLNKIEMQGEVVIGEGEIDEAPMLFIGETVGKGIGEYIDIAVDPIEGTRMTAMGQNNAISVLAAGEKGSFLKAPDMYMEKLVTGPQAKNVIDLNLSLEENVINVAEALNKPINKLTLVTLSKPRHDKTIEKLQKLGIKIFAFPDGDVAASILTCMPNHEVDIMYCIGGAPEGVISAAVIRALGGDMQGRLLTRDLAKGNNPQNLAIAKEESRRCKIMNVQPNHRIFTLSELVSSDNIVFSATGITKGDLLEGVSRKGNTAETETLVVRGRSRTIRRIRSIHYIDKKDQDIKQFIQ